MISLAGAHHSMFSMEANMEGLERSVREAVEFEIVMSAKRDALTHLFFPVRQVTRQFADITENIADDILLMPPLGFMGRRVRNE